jgi:hypothetical protein
MLLFYFQSLNEGLIDIDCSWNSFRNRGGAALLSSLAVRSLIIFVFSDQRSGNTKLAFNL